MWLADERPSSAISHQAIYDHVADNQELKQYLRRKGKRPRYGKKRGKPKIHLAAPPKVSILERPEIISSRQEPGHWEVDTVGAKSPSTILILVERTSRFSMLVKVPDKKADTVKNAIFSLLKDLPPELRRSLTYDNGSENADHWVLNQELGTSSFFCLPYHSWEKGSVENRIGVLRIFFPKKTNFDLVTDEQVARAQFLLNNRPMKLLGGKFPATKFNNFIFELLKLKAA